MPAEAHADASLDTVFAPVRSQTAFEETVDRLGTAIKLGLLTPGHAAAARARALLAARDRALDAAPGAHGADRERPPVRGARARRRHVRRRPAAAGRPARRRGARRAGARSATCGWRSSSASSRSPASARTRAALDALGELVERMDDLLGEYEAFRPADVRFHIGLAEASGSGAAGRRR